MKSVLFIFFLIYSDCINNFSFQLINFFKKQEAGIRFRFVLFFFYLCRWQTCLHSFTSKKHGFRLKLRVLTPKHFPKNGYEYFPKINFLFTQTLKLLIYYLMFFIRLLIWNKKSLKKKTKKNFFTAKYLIEFKNS